MSQPELIVELDRITAKTNQADPADQPAEGGVVEDRVDVIDLARTGFLHGSTDLPKRLTPRELRARGAGHARGVPIARQL